jgi:hypothetical protein
MVIASRSGRSGYGWAWSMQRTRIYARPALRRRVTRPRRQANATDPLPTALSVELCRSQHRQVLLISTIRWGPGP